jgi:hypothetical protein
MDTTSFLPGRTDPSDQVSTKPGALQILEGKNRGRHFVSKTPLAASQIALESGLGSTFDRSAAVTHQRLIFNTGIAFLPVRCVLHDRFGDVSIATIADGR